MAIVVIAGSYHSRTDRVLCIPAARNEVIPLGLCSLFSSLSISLSFSLPLVEREITSGKIGTEGGLGDRSNNDDERGERERELYYEFMPVDPHWPEEFDSTAIHCVAVFFVDPVH